MRRIFHHVFFIAALFGSAHAFANNDQNSIRGGAALEFPRGRFQENDVPNFFKWNLRKPAKTIALKVFRADEKGNYDKNSGLISRFDFNNTINSFTWSGEVFPLGHYVWVIEGYDDKSAQPLFVDSAQFEV